MNSAEPEVTAPAPAAEARPPAAPVPLACGNCAFWARQPPDPHNLGAAPPGQCREHLRVLGVQVRVPQGVAVQVQGVYPVVPADFPGCGRFVPAGGR